MSIYTLIVKPVSPSPGESRLMSIYTLIDGTSLLEGD